MRSRSTYVYICEVVYCMLYVCSGYYCNCRTRTRTRTLVSGVDTVVQDSNDAIIDNSRYNVPLYFKVQVVRLENR